MRCALLAACMMIVAPSLAGCGGGGGICGDTTVATSSISGPITYDGVSAVYSQTDVGAFADNLVASYSVGPDVDVDDEAIHISFAGAPLATGSFALEAQKAQLCHDYLHGPVCGDVAGTMVVTQFLVDACGEADKIGCPTHFDADLRGTTLREGRAILLDVHLHVDGKRVAYQGCVADRLGK